MVRHFLYKISPIYLLVTGITLLSAKPQFISDIQNNTDNNELLDSPVYKIASFLGDNPEVQQFLYEDGSADSTHFEQSLSSEENATALEPVESTLPPTEKHENPKESMISESGNGTVATPSPFSNLKAADSPEKLLQPTGRLQFELKHGGFRNFLCGNKKVLKCFVDCIFNHGTVGGMCLTSLGIPDNYACMCAFGLENPFPNKYSLHCNVLSEKYAKICDTDCVCNHAAEGGFCDFTRSACVCYRQGQNFNNTRCPFKDGKSFAKFIHDNLDPDDMRGLKYNFIMTAMKA